MSLFKSSTVSILIRKSSLILILILLASSNVCAIDFKIKGEWLMGFGAGTGELYSSYRSDKNSPKYKVNAKDCFEANQRVRLQLDAAVSEALSGTVYFEIGDQRWGMEAQGGALGSDSNKIIRLKNAYIDFGIPHSEFHVRMGILPLTLPNAAGGSAILDADVAGIVSSYKFTDSVGITAIWARPVNDNFTAAYGAKSNQAGYLDNIDLFALALPIEYDGITISPWIMYGLFGKNSLRGLAPVNDNEPWVTSDGVLGLTVPGLVPGFNYLNSNPLTASSASLSYGAMFWAGLPFTLSFGDAWNFEFDFNYGFVEEMGRYDIIKRGNLNDIVKGSTQRQGWLAKALLEYRFDWGIPGILGWYSSGDDGNIKNGSERMPSIAGAGTFTSFIADGNYGWGTFDDSCYLAMTYSGTWGLGLQIRDISLIEDLSHTLRAVYWGGTNSPSMVKYMENSYSWREGYYGEGPYLTTNDGILEINFINNLKLYENFNINLEFSYLVNMIDKNT